MSDEMNSFTQSVYVVGEGVEVPVPAEADSGKVLTAGDDGSVSWETGGGGGGAGVLIPVMDSVTQNLNVSYNDIASALSENKVIYFYAPIISQDIDEEERLFYFASMQSYTADEVTYYGVFFLHFSVENNRMGLYYFETDDATSNLEFNYDGILG